MCKIDAALPKSKKKETDAGKVERRIGLWQGHNPAASWLLGVMVLKDEKQRAIGLQLSCPIEKGVFAEDKLHGNRPRKTMALVNATYPDGSV